MGREKGENKGCGGLGPERVCGVGGGVVGMPVYPWEAGLMWFGLGGAFGGGLIFFGVDWRRFGVVWCVSMDRELRNNFIGRIVIFHILKASESRVLRVPKTSV